MKPKSHELKELAQKFIMANRTASLATSNESGIPHVAPVLCIVEDDLTIYFSTRVEGRKYINLLQNPTVAMAFTDDDKLTAIQLTGKAERINDLNIENDILHRLMTLRHNYPNWPIPTMQLFVRGATNEIAIIKVVPSEMTYANFESSKQPDHPPFFQKVI